MCINKELKYLDHYGKDMTTCTMYNNLSSASFENNLSQITSQLKADIIKCQVHLTFIFKKRKNLHFFFQFESLHSSTLCMLTLDLNRSIFFSKAGNNHMYVWTAQLVLFWRARSMDVSNQGRHYIPFYTDWPCAYLWNLATWSTVKVVRSVCFAT